MASSPVYSQLFYAGLPSLERTTLAFTVPTGFVYIVRQCSIVVTLATGNQVNLWQDPPHVIVIEAQYQNPPAPQQFSGRWVVPAGSSWNIQPVGVSPHVTISGYKLTVPAA